MPIPTIDIVIATNRSSPFLTDTLTSVVGQTYTHWTLTVVDDGCPDPDALAATVSQVPAATVVQHEGRGVSAARNAGAARGSGELVAFLDDDDVWDPTKLSKQVNALTSAVGGIGCFTGGWYLDATGASFGSGWPATRAAATDFLRGAVPLPRIVTLVLRRAEFDAVGGFNPAYAIGEDHDLALRLLQRGEMVPVPEPLVGYRRHEHNTSVADDLDGRRAGVGLFRALIATSEDAGETHTAALLREHLIRSRAQWGHSAMRSIAGAVRRHDLRSLRREAAFAARVVPLETIKATTRVILERRTRCAGSGLRAGGGPGAGSSNADGGRGS